MHTEVPEVLVRAPRVTLDEILDRVARGEARRDSSIHDEQFLATFRMVRGVDSKKGPEVFAERVMRVYKRKPHDVRAVTVRRYDVEPPKKKDMDVTFRPDTDEEIVNFAFKPDARRDFKYRIVGRDFVGGHLIYRIAFEPRSALDPTMPSGLVWVDTNDFVIVRQEVTFTRSPVPMIIKDVERMVIERRRYGDYWVLGRVLLRIRSTMPLPKVGKAFDVSLLFEDYAINAGIDDAVFKEPAK